MLVCMMLLMRVGTALEMKENEAHGVAKSVDNVDTE